MQNREKTHPSSPADWLYQEACSLVANNQKVTEAASQQIVLDLALKALSSETEKDVPFLSLLTNNDARTVMQAGYNLGGKDFEAEILRRVMSEPQEEPTS